MSDPAARCTRSCFIPRSCTPKAASTSSATSPTAICGCTGDWTMASFVEQATAKIRAQVGSERVVCALSGGVDSTVAALPASGDRRSAHLHLRRQRRASTRRGRADRQALRAAATAADLRRCVDAFLERLAGVTDPEQKRKIIGTTFIDVFEAEAAKLGAGRFSRARHALSGRHRVGVDRRAIGADQEPSQRRRAAEEDEVEARRAAARAVQGRSARARAASSGSTRNSSCANRSPARARRAHPREVTPKRSTSCGAPTPSWSKR